MMLVENEIILRLLNAGNSEDGFVRLHHSQTLTKLERSRGGYNFTNGTSWISTKDNRRELQSRVLGPT